MADLVRSYRSTSRQCADIPPQRSPVLAPRPTGPSAGRVLPNGMATFVNEMRPAYRIGQQHPNPGRDRGQTRRDESNPQRSGIRPPLPGELP